MKGMVLVVVAVVLVAGQAFARGPLETDTEKAAAINGFAPSGLRSVVLTLYSAWFDMTKYAAFSATAPADCKMRLAATQSKSGTVSEPVYGNQWNTVVVSSETPWVNYSGCASGVLRRSKLRP